jgi:hypothetical protein
MTVFPPLPRLPTIVHDGRFVGHGQQLAAARLRDAFRPVRHRAAIDDLTRQQLRRVNQKQDKKTQASIRANLSYIALAEMRRSREPWQLPKVVPGKLAIQPSLAQSARRPGSRRGTADRRVLSKAVEVVPAIGLLPERRYEYWFHATKGYRCERLPA